MRGSNGKNIIFEDGTKDVRILIEEVFKNMNVLKADNQYGSDFGGGK